LRPDPAADSCAAALNRTLPPGMSTVEIASMSVDLPEPDAPVMRKPLRATGMS